jgi:hypothetical protein
VAAGNKALVAKIEALGFRRLYLEIPGPRPGTLAIVLDKADQVKFDLLPRGKDGGTIEVTDQITGYPHIVERAPCGLRCYCAARLSKQARV